MIITYFRSSSYNTFDFCEQQYYMSYVLGLPELSNKAANKGSTVHKILEEIAVKKTKNIVLTNKQIDNLIIRTYKKFSTSNKMNHNKWTDKDQRDCKNWTWKALNDYDKQFDPRNPNTNIVAAEPHFDFTLPYDWAKYSYKLNGKTIKGQLCIKGTIDLVQDIGDNTYEVVDYKTGQCKNWATGEAKTQASLHNDPQLLLYHYAVRKMYPKIKNVLVTIYYINSGGPFTMCFDDTDLKRMENMLKKRFEIIKNATNMKQINDWKCTRLCTFGQKTFENTKHPMLDDGSGFPCTQCNQIHKEILRTGIDKTTEKYLYEENAFKNYAAPGEL